jgi:hypothetical protein
MTDRRLQQVQDTDVEPLHPIDLPAFPAAIVPVTSTDGARPALRRHTVIAPAAWPNCFLVGAPKCGTTALYDVLRRHPAVFLPACKEPHFFGSDLAGRWFVRDRAAYTALFAGAARTGVRCVGDASVFYLYSRRAAREIAAACPDARIVVALRDPVTVMHALHAQLYYNGNEDIADFGAALDAEPMRRRTRQAPNANYPPDVLWYREVARFADQVERYLDVFGRQHVHVVLHDDLVGCAGPTLRALLRFLDLDEAPALGLRTVNAAKGVRSARLHRLLMSPPARARRVVCRVVPGSARAGIVRAIQAANTRRGRRAPLDPLLRARLRAEFAPQVERLGVLIGRDLSAWKHDDG